MVQTRSQTKKLQQQQNKQKEFEDDLKTIKMRLFGLKSNLLPNTSINNVKYNLMQKLNEFFEYKNLHKPIQKNSLAYNKLISIAVEIFNITSNPYGKELLQKYPKFKNAVGDKLMEFYYYYKEKQFYKIYRDIFGYRMPINDGILNQMNLIL